MNLVDVNLLLYATNPRYPEHQRAKVWWEAQLNGSGPVGLSWQTLAAFIRIATNPKIFQQPLSRQQAVSLLTSGWRSRSCAYWNPRPSIGRRFDGSS